MSEEDKVKQVIVVRTRYPHPTKEGEFYKPRTGKLIAQGAHACMSVFLNMNVSQDPRNMVIMIKDDVKEWVEGQFTKICVKVDSEEELLSVYQKAKDAGLPCSLIRDAGHTEFSEPTYTTVAVGPARSSKIDLITGDLQLY